MADERGDLQLEKAKVVLVSIPDQKNEYEVIKVLAAQLGVSFEEGADILKHLPNELLPSIPIEAGEKFAETVRKAGGEVEVLPIGKAAGRFCSTHPYRRARARCKDPGCDKYICEICIREAGNRLLCPECFKKFKRRRVLIALGSVAALVIILMIWFKFGDLIFTSIRRVAPLSTKKVMLVCMTRILNEEMAKHYTKLSSTPIPGVARDPRARSFTDVDAWYQREYERFTSNVMNIVQLDVYGLYEITGEVPRIAKTYSGFYQRLKVNHAFYKFFKDLIDVNNLRIKSYDYLLFIELTNNTGVTGDALERLGMVYSDIGYMKYPVTGEFSADYYLEGVAYYVARLMGASEKVDDYGFPIFPVGYAEPKQAQRHPQGKAEIMGCYIPISPSQTQRITALDQAVVGGETAYELRWISRAERNFTYSGVTP